MTYERKTARNQAKEESAIAFLIMISIGAAGGIGIAIAALIQSAWL